MTIFPYNKLSMFQRYETQLKQSNVVAFYFPGTLMPQVRELQARGIQVMAYISIYKAGLISEVGPGTGFAGGSCDREEITRNPFWQTTSLTPPLKRGNGHEVAVDGQGVLRRPFGKKDYKRGWYQVCLHHQTRRLKIEQGVSRLLDQGLDGVFVDNVIPHAPCLDTVCRVQATDQTREQVQILNRIYYQLKTYSNPKLVYLNVGKEFLLHPRIHADVYVMENFCYGDRLACYSPRLKDDRLFLASQYYNSESKLLTALKQIQRKTSALGIELIGYTKVDPGLPADQITDRLRRSEAIARKAGIQWTTRLRIPYACGPRRIPT